MKKACFSRTSVHKNFKNHLYPDPTRFSGPQTKYRPGKDLSHFRHGNLTPDRGIKCRNRSTKSTKSVFMSDITAKIMVAGFKRLPQRAYLGGYTSYFGSRTHFQLATFYALTETPDYVRATDGSRRVSTPLQPKFGGLRNRFVRWWVLGCTPDNPISTLPFEKSRIFLGANRGSAGVQPGFSSL